MLDNPPELTFASLFRKHRLRSQFNTLAAFCSALHQEGIVFDPSILSHWQNGKREPADRNLILVLIKIFKERSGLTNIEEANLLLESVNQGNLTANEISSFFKDTSSKVFQIPRDIDFFVGREDYISSLSQNLVGKIFLFHGISGSGKTSLAIKIANKSRHLFPDGIIWIRLDSLSVYEALNHIGNSLGNDLTAVKNIHSKSALLRSFLSKKRVLLILDNVEHFNDVDLLFPNTSGSSVIVTSIYQNTSLVPASGHVLVEPFTNQESQELFNTVLGNDVAQKNSRELMEISQIVGNLPLAVNLAALQIKNHGFSPSEFLTFFHKGEITLDQYEYQGKTLFKTIDLAFNRIDPTIIKILKSMCVFCGEDFSAEILAALHNEERIKIKRILENLVDSSLVQRATGSRYKMHPLITQYCSDQMAKEKIEILIILANYFSQFIDKKFDNLQERPEITREIHLILLVIKKCLEQGLRKEVIAIWKSFSIYLWETGRWQLLDELGEQIVVSCKEIKDYRSAALFLIRERTWFYYWRTNFQEAKNKITEGLQLAEQLHDDYLIAFAKQRFGVLLTKEGKVEKAESYLQEALCSFIEQTEQSHITDNYLYLGHIAKKKGNAQKAIDYYLKSLKSAIEIGDIKAETIADSYLGATSFDINNLQDAENYYSSALTIDESIENKAGMTYSLLGLAKIKFAQSNKEKSKELLGRAKDLCLKLELFDLMPEIEKTEQLL